MNIILGKNNVGDISDRYVVLELDTLVIPGHNSPVTAYALIERHPVIDMASIPQFQELHGNLIRNYKLRNWKYCTDAIGHLLGRWNGEIDSFYETMLQRLETLLGTDPGKDWDGSVALDSKFE
jgi:hypothetical protein